MDLFKVIAEMSGEGQNLVIPRLYVKLAGGHVEALVLKQLVFWSNKTKRTDGYFYKKSEELEKEVELTKRQVDRVVKNLVKTELIEVKLKRANGAPTRHFKINENRITARLYEMVQTESTVPYIEKVRNGTNGKYETVQTLTDSNTDSNNRQKDNIDQPAASGLTERFEAVYKHYPRKQGKKPAFAAYKRAIKAGVTDETIIDGIQRYCFMLEKERTPKQFIKQAGTWFNQEGWNDVYATDKTYAGNSSAGEQGARNGGHFRQLANSKNNHAERESANGLEF